jgi:hypothetical protein
MLAISRKKPPFHGIRLSEAPALNFIERQIEGVR